MGVCYRKKKDDCLGNGSMYAYKNQNIVSRGGGEGLQIGVTGSK